MLEATVAAAPMHAGGCRHPPTPWTPTPTTRRRRRGWWPTRRWPTPRVARRAPGGGGAGGVRALAAAAASSGGGDSDEAEGVTLYRSHHNVTGYVAHISAQFGAIGAIRRSRRLPPLWARASASTASASPRRITAPRHLPDGNRRRHLLRPARGRARRRRRPNRRVPALQPARIGDLAGEAAAEAAAAVAGGGARAPTFACCDLCGGGGARWCRRRRRGGPAR